MKDSERRSARGGNPRAKSFRNFFYNVKVTCEVAMYVHAGGDAKESCGGKVVTRLDNSLVWMLNLFYITKATASWVLFRFPETVSFHFFSSLRPINCPDF